MGQWMEAGRRCELAYFLLGTLQVQDVASVHLLVLNGHRLGDVAQEFSVAR